jgi:hypothetical protein
MESGLLQRDSEDSEDQKDFLAQGRRLHEFEEPPKAKD